jgi:hypothetical protein
MFTIQYYYGILRDYPLPDIMEIGPCNQPYSNQKLQGMQKHRKISNITHNEKKNKLIKKSQK